MRDRLEKKLNLYERHSSNGKCARRRTEVWAHRGASGYAPENTLPAFQLAMEMGADGIELDVQLTKDGEIVVLHDERIDRTSNGKGNVSDFTLAELKKFNFNKYYPEQFGDVQIPTLRDVYALIKDTGMIVDVELKSTAKTSHIWDNLSKSPELEILPTKLIELADDCDICNQIVYSSFDVEALTQIKKLRADAYVGYLTEHAISVQTPAYCRMKRFDAVNPKYIALHRNGFVKACELLDVDINAWTVNAALDMRRAFEIGIHAVITNYPDIAVHLRNSI
ncbi:MAG: glycerophosphodiester phosphodiesterase [Clostridiales Family XIII bacterium]|jgi:glycerophosphoryl diester phosphodiesterase|nr:glycerophosphodiester phosphodiesterase [Clostridiales Family XIII bacterium]